MQDELPMIVRLDILLRCSYLLSSIDGDDETTSNWSHEAPDTIGALLVESDSICVSISSCIVLLVTFLALCCWLFVVFDAVHLIAKLQA